MHDYYVTLSYATYLVRVREGYVYAAAPIARWMIGKPWKTCREWILRKGGDYERLYDSH